MAGVNNPSTWMVATHASLPNGAAHRLASALANDGHEVALCAVPLPWSSRLRAERQFPGDPAISVLIDELRVVPARRELRSAIDLGRFAWRLHRLGWIDVAMVGCDPISFLEALIGLTASPLRIRATAAWFVDWSAHRLDDPVRGTLYRSATRMALRRAHVTATISPSATVALSEMVGTMRDVMTLPNQPITAKNVPAWEARPPAVVYAGGLSDHQGVEILLRTAEMVTREGIKVHVAGDGTATKSVAEAAHRIPGLYFHGLLEDPEDLISLMIGCRVGWALYDPGYSMYEFGDSLKIKDYLAAGLVVVSTLPTSAEDGVVHRAAYNVASVLNVTRTALGAAPPFQPQTHPSLGAAARSFREFTSAMEKQR